MFIGNNPLSTRGGKMVDLDKNLDANNQNQPPIEDSDDTKTRKTVRLRPSVTPAGINLNPLPKTSLSGSPNGRDTDTGNIEVLEDTQTRRTVKLKPIATQTSPTLNKPVNDGANTQTRKTIVLKPTTISPSSVNLGGASGAASSESEDTKTRKTVRLRPSTTAPGVKITGEDSHSEIDSSDTIRIARPTRTGMLPPKIPKPGTMAANQPSKSDTSNSMSHSLPTQKPSPKASSVDIPGLKEKTASASAPKGQDSSADKKTELAFEPKPFPQADAPSPLYLALAAVSVVLVAVTVTLTTVQYLNLFHQQNIELPFLSQSR